MRSRWIFRARRVDRGQIAIVHALEAVGATVVDLSAVGRGCPDLLVGMHGVDLLVEVKAPLGPRGGCSEKGQRLRETQEAFRGRWRGAPVLVVRDPMEAVQVVIEASKRTTTGEKS